MAEDGLTELAKLFKDRDNRPPSSITTGIVISPPPQAEIRLNAETILYNRQLVWSAHMLMDYQREIELEGKILFQDSNAGTTGSSDGHSHSIETLSVDTTFQAIEVKLKTINTVQAGDEVILMPVSDNQLYFVLDKAVRFE